MAISKEAWILAGCEALLGWDERTYMPKNGAEARSNQVALLSGMIHDRMTAPRVGELLDVIEGSDLLSDPESVTAVSFREARRGYEKQVKLPKDLVEALAKTTSLAQSVWTEARQKSDFGMFLPKLKEVIDLKHRQAEAYGYETEPYDALLDDYEPDMTSAEISRVFGELRDELVPLVKKIADSPKKPDISIIENDYPVDLQEKFGREAAAAIGYDFDSGRLDVTAHPFTIGIAPGDVRITTRYNPKHLGQALFGTLHEGGHAMYEQGLPYEHYGTHFCDSVSLGIHESQSRMWENLVGRGKPFWDHFFPKAKGTFPVLKDVSFEDFFFAINDVRPSLIRVEADEVTYNLHILLRFEIERDVFSGKIKAEDLPAVWNEKFNDYFGLTPANDSEGCMQDVHWSAGLFGYFATYALGNLYASQFFGKAKADMPDMETKFASGDYSGLLSWLRKNIHSQGKRYHAKDLVEKVTGKSLSHKPMMEYLNTKYGELYGV